MTYSETLAKLQQRYPNGAPAGINLEDLAQLKTQNTFETSRYFQSYGDGNAQRYGPL